MRCIYTGMVTFFLCVLNYGCIDLIKKKNKGSREESFYTNTGGFGLPRIPLLKPYELRKVSTNQWSMELYSPIYALGIDNVKSVNISESKILVYSQGGTEIRFKDNIRSYDQAWFLIDTLTKTELPFVDHKEFRSKIHEVGITDTLMKYPDDVYQEFAKSRKIKW